MKFYKSDVRTGTDGSVGAGQQVVDSGSVLLVAGISSPIENMFNDQPIPLPIVVEATLLPFKGRIITDSLASSYNLMSGAGVKKMLKDVYMTAKKEGRIITSLQ